MATKSAIVSPDKISAKQFADALAKYSTIVKAISASKGAKNGQKTLEELDQYRYVEAPECFAIGKSERPMALDDVKVLVEWKLRHGKFRPTLMKLVSSNEPNTVKSTIQEALKSYQDKSSVAAALDILTKLKGIGPATASLLLAVHDAERVIFFSDEAFYWLCCDGKEETIKYNAKEYAALNVQAKNLAKRLGVSATDVEKVAYVLMKQRQTTSKPSETKVAAKASTSKAPDKEAPPAKQVSSAKGGPPAKRAPAAPAKRKTASDQDRESNLPTRRSKRGKTG